MLVFSYRFSFFLLLILATSGCGQEETHQTPAAAAGDLPLFTLLSPQQTGVAFQNTLSEGLNTNILMYEYFYNGGGVAAGDFNGDGLIDLYFSANMSDNRLYLNRGNMQFTDVTAASGAGGRAGPWKTGVTIVDIDGDGKLDIYLCYSGALPEAKRANQLFINQGNDENGVPRFEEKAAEYGLASTAYSNQGYFFDYDRDGDLDLLLLNHNPKSLPILNEVSTAAFLKQDDPQIGVRLYRQQARGRFEDVTQQAGISGSALTYGLGIGISDVNGDGWPDFYLSNDYNVPDYLYINNQNGTFTDQLAQSIGHNSQFSMGNDIADINNDGLPDIITLDMLPEDNHRQKLLLAPDNYAKFDLNVRSGFHYQYMRNMLQLNNGNGTFSEIGQLAGISNTDWSWAALLADFDNDGWKDLFVTNGYHRDYTNLDFVNYMDAYVKTKGRLMREDVIDIINYMPASDVVNYLFSNQGGRTFVNQTESWGINYPSNSNGAVYADLDNDGDLDLVVNNINREAFIFQNKSQNHPDRGYLQVRLRGEGLNTQGIGARLSLYARGMRQDLEQYPARGYLSSVSPVLHVGLGKAKQADSLVIIWAGGRQQVLRDVAANQVIELAEKDAVPVKKRPIAPPKGHFSPIPSPIDHENPRIFVNDFDRQGLLTSGLSFSGPCMAQGDFDGDGLEDVFVGGAAGQAAAVFFQQKNGQFLRKRLPAFDADPASEDAAVAIFDANGDGYPDLYVASGGYHTFREDDPLLQDRLYFNDGKGNFVKSFGALPDIRSSTGCVAAGDMNGDGHADLFVGGRVIPGRYPEAPASYLLINDGKGNFTDHTAALAPQLARLGMITAAIWADLDGNGKQELVLVGEWLPVSVFAVENGKWENHTSRYFDKEYKGWWNALEVADINGDGKPDVLAGNMGTNTQFRASDAEPVEMIFQDFDENGSVDPLLCAYIQGESYPYVTRDELLRQLGGLRSRFTSYKSYADIRLSDLFSPEQLARAGRWEANHLETTFFLSTTTGKYAPATLPPEAQYAPVYTLTVLDYDGDGHEDVLLCGNNSHAKLRLGKFDANYGILLRGDGQGQFEYVKQSVSGLDLRGDVRSVRALGNTLFFGMNQGKVIAYQWKK